MINPRTRYVIANDLSPAAVEAMKRNIAINDLTGGSDSDPTRQKVQVNEGDAWYDCFVLFENILYKIFCSSSLMYNHRDERRRVDVVDLDPYGTAAPFIDAAVQCVNDGGKIIELVFLSMVPSLQFRPTMCYMYRSLCACNYQFP
jgi:tRNA (guanine26-N2/guanine27-N2)-dimethyltransferase